MFFSVLLNTGFIDIASLCQTIHDGTIEAFFGKKFRGAV
jgi:hypothetical protein